MKITTTSVALLVALVGATSFAVFHDGPASASAPATGAAMQRAQPLEPARVASEGVLPCEPAREPLGEDESESPGGAEDESASAENTVQPSALATALAWKVPGSWPSAPNPSSMRIATHKVPRTKGDAEDAELSITRAGGDLEANVQRWADQFEGASGARRRDKTVRGLKIAVVELEGSYQGGMGSESSPHGGWALLGAIVLTPEEPYFFKLTGPVATVRAAHAEFEALLDSLTPIAP